MEKLFPYPAWDNDKLSGIGEYILYFFFVLPYFIYLFLCLKTKLKENVSEDLYQKLKD